MRPLKAPEILLMIFLCWNCISEQQYNIPVYLNENNNKMHGYFAQK